MIFDFSISIPVWRKSSPNKVNFDRFFGGFWQFLRRWYELDPNRLQHNNQCKILNKISPIWATFEQIFDFLKKWLSKISLCGVQNQKNRLFSAPGGPNAKIQIPSESASKNTSKKSAQKKNSNTPTQKIDFFNFLTMFTWCSTVWTMKKIESNGSMCLTGHKHG